MEITRIANRKIYEEITEQIKRNIVQGILKPGDKLPSTKELSDKYGVGRSTIREALSALKAMGMIEIRHGEGCFVLGMESADAGLPVFGSRLLDRGTVLELLEARKSLEISNAAIAAEKRSDADLRVIGQILETMGRSLGSERESEQADLQFHQALAEATHNSIMARLLASISGQMELAIKETRRLQMYSNERVSLRLWKEHTNIFEAVKRKDSLEAESSMRYHLQYVEELIIKYLP